MRKFTKQQVDYICANLNFWYMQAWKNDLSKNSSKESLQKIVCGLEKYENLEDEYDINPKTHLWETEPDFLEFVDESTGYRCFIQRHPELKHLCGYVELPKEHKLYGETNVDNELLLNLDVHGGVTYANKKKYYVTIKAMCFTIDFVVGFDCGHWTDYVPYSLPWGMNKIIGDETYKDIEYVTNECKKLAKQLKELE